MRAKALTLLLAVNVLSAQAVPSQKAPALHGGYSEVSVYDLPAGSFTDLDKAFAEYQRRAQRGEPQLPPGPREEADRAVARFKAEQAQPEAVIDARLASWYTPADRLVSNDSPLKLKPFDVAVTQPCTLVHTAANGVRRKALHTGFSRYYQCASGDVYLRDMLLEGVRITRIKEQNNVDLGTVQGQMRSALDNSGYSYTRLTRVSNNTDHLIQKARMGPRVEA